MSELQRLNTVNIPLAGTKLIEASAGTGKTYAITGLYIRLLLEKELDVDTVLVLTFTEAATKELRERVRSRLQDALAVYEEKSISDEFLHELYAKHCREGRSIQQCRQRLSLALHSIDLAAIYTIHGFCARVLQDSAFESGLLFDLELSENDSELLGQIIDDYWRIQVGSWSDLFLQYLFARKINADTLFSKLSGVVKIARAAGIHRIDFPPRLSPDQFSFSMDGLVSLWQESEDEIIELLASKALSKAKTKGWYHPDSVAEWQKEIDDYFHDGENNLLPVQALEKFSSGSLVKGTQPSKIGQTPEHEFFRKTESLISQLSQSFNGLCFEIIEYCLAQLPERKNAAAVLSFDDLLLLVRDGLRNKESGPRLAEKIRQQYQALLIDEFQDTDAVQYEIFQSIYGAGKNAMFLIGDPKQAIYRFRGADIYAYLKAIKSAGSEVYGMDTNWRSEPELVHGFNLLFGFTGRVEPFYIPDIFYHHVQAAARQGPILSVEGEDARPISFLSFPEQGKKGNAKKFIAQDLARQIRKLITTGRQGKAYFVTPSSGDGEQEERQALKAGHMAVLVRSHKDAELVRSALVEQGVRSVLHTRQEVFATNEARELQIILTGVIRSTEVRCVKTALATSLLGWRAEELLRLDEDEGLGEKTTERFADYLKLWEDKGFAVMAFRLLRRDGIISRIAGCRNGERRLTNLRHIVEILQEASHQERLGPAVLLDWFQRQRHAEEKNEERLLRLESDESLVKIVTIHKSKGLEYPLVFCPFLWDAPYQVKKDKGWVAWHDGDGNERVDMGTEAMADRHGLQVRENMAEEFRLLYVALTRARNRCCIYWGNVRSRKSSVTAKSALAYLLKSFCPPEKFALEQNDSMPSGLDDSLFAPLYEMAACAPKSVSVSGSELLVEVQEIDAVPPPELRPVSTDFRTLEPSWDVLSFSALLRSEKEAKEEQAHEDFFPPQERGRFSGPGIENPEKNMFNFPKGAQPGSCLHDIFERLDFTSSYDEQTSKRVKDTLDMYGINNEWSAPLLDGIEIILKTALDSEKEGLCLNQIGMEQRINELEFYYSIPRYFHKQFHSIFRGNSEKASQEQRGGQKEEIAPLCYMKGFIDLVFEWQGQYYIVDYKSNYLGDQYEDYHQARLNEEMIKSSYDMQYHIYLVALHRYLQQRVPDYDYDSHMGGVYYLFIRGMSPEKGPGFGVFKDLPGREVIEGMEKMLNWQGAIGNPSEAYE